MLSFGGEINIVDQKYLSLGALKQNPAYISFLAFLDVSKPLTYMNLPCISSSQDQRTNQLSHLGCSCRENAERNFLDNSGKRSQPKDSRM